MDFVLVLLLVADLSVGLLFGIVGHLFSILTFPLLALLRGYLGMKKHHNYTSAFFITFTGASLFFFGLMIGVIIQTAGLNSQTGIIEISSAAISKAINLSLLTAFIYFLLYMLLGTLSAYLCRGVDEVQKLDKADKNDEDVRDV